MLDDRLPRRAVAGDDVDDALRQPGLAADVGEQQRGERGVFGGLQDHGVPGGERGGDLPRQHQEGEVPRDDLAADAEGGMGGEFLGQKLRQARVVVEMPLGEGDVDVARFADRLAVVEGFEDGEEAGMLLEKAGQRVEVARAGVAGELRPFREGAAGGGHGGVDIVGGALRDLGKGVAGRGVFRGEGLPRAREAAVDEMTEGGALGGDPGADLGVAFGGGAVIHGVEDLAGCHLDRPFVPCRKENCSFPGRRT
jgi:hypothetical protein